MTYPNNIAVAAAAVNKGDNYVRGRSMNRAAKPIYPKKR